VERDPREREPARPVPATEHKRTADNRDQTDERYPDDVMLKGMLRTELSEVKGNPECTRRYVQAAEDGHGERTFVHGTITDYSCRSASSGSIRAARRAGM